MMAYRDPWDEIEFPRERRPWKRDRQSVEWAMRCAIQDRRRQRPLGRYDNGEGYGCRDHVQRILELLHAAQGRQRLWWVKQQGKTSRSVILRDLAAVHTAIEGARFRDKVPLPSLTTKDQSHG